MPDMSGIDLLREVASARRRPGHPHDRHSDVRTAVEASGSGPTTTSRTVESAELIATIERATQHHQLLARNRYSSDSSTYGHASTTSSGVGDDAARLRAHRVGGTGRRDGAGSRETGTGKELIARAIHRRSPRQKKPLVAINCGALTETLLESELFGHARGAFTGANAARRGLFDEASGDAVPGRGRRSVGGDPGESSFVPCRRARSDRSARRVAPGRRTRGGATNRNLVERVAAGAFREDLYYRLNVITIELPALRERPEDIRSSLITSCRSTRRGSQARDQDRSGRARAPAAARVAGNVRELEHTIERGVILAKGRVDRIGRGADRSGAARPAATTSSAASTAFAQAKQDAMAAFERSYIEGVLSRAGEASPKGPNAGLDPRTSVA